MMRSRLSMPISSPFQQLSAVLATRDFLLRLCNPKATPRISLDVRGEARALLRHYPLRERLEPILRAALEPGPEERQGPEPNRPPSW